MSPGKACLQIQVHNNCTIAFCFTVHFAQTPNFHIITSISFSMPRSMLPPICNFNDCSEKIALPALGQINCARAHAGLMHVCTMTLQGSALLFPSHSANANSFNYLFKSLFMFPSWYLSTISFKHILFFAWNLPRILHSNAKECDSPIARRAQRFTNDTQEHLLHWCCFPVDLHLPLHWPNI